MCFDPNLPVLKGHFGTDVPTVEDRFRLIDLGLGHTMSPERPFDLHSLRYFLLNSLSSLSATWVAAAHWPAALAAAQHAHNSAQSAAPLKFEFFTPEMAAEVDAIIARIIP